MTDNHHCATSRWAYAVGRWRCSGRVLLLLLFLCSGAWGGESQTRADAAMREAWLRFEQVMQDWRARYPQRLPELTQVGMPTARLNDFLLALNRSGVSAAQLSAVTETVQRSLDMTVLPPATRDATAYDGGDTVIGACGGASFGQAFNLSVTTGLLENVMAAVSWACEETVAGFNDASACAYPQLELQGLKGFLEDTRFCVEDIERGVHVATFKTVYSLGEHLDAQLDAELESRASAEQVDDLKEQVKQVQDTLDAYFPVYFPAIALRQQQTADQAAQQGVQLTDVQQRLQNRQQDQRLLLALLEDSNRRQADTRQDALEVRSDTQDIRQHLSIIRSRLTGEQASLSAEARVLRDWGLALQVVQRNAVTGDNPWPLRYYLPVFQGGELETVREWVYENMQMAQAAGFDITPAQARFALADGQYNMGGFAQALDDYIAAYRLIAGPAQ